MRDDEEIVVENREDITRSQNKRAYLYMAYMMDGKIVLEPVKSN